MNWKLTHSMKCPLGITHLEAAPLGSSSTLCSDCVRLCLRIIPVPTPWFRGSDPLLTNSCGGASSSPPRTTSADTHSVFTIPSLGFTFSLLGKLVLPVTLTLSTFTRLVPASREWVLLEMFSFEELPAELVVTVILSLEPIPVSLESVSDVWLVVDAKFEFLARLPLVSSEEASLWLDTLRRLDVFLACCIFSSWSVFLISSKS